MPVAAEYRVAHWIDGREGVVLDRRVVSDRIDEDLAEDIKTLLASSFRPAGSEKLVLEALHTPKHSLMGVDGFTVGRRLLRRACERLWPPNSPAPEIHRKAAFLLLQDGRCTVRLSPFTGLCASRD